MIKIKDLFIRKMGTDMELVRLQQVPKNSENCINFVSRTSKNNGVSAIVKKIEGVNPSPAHSLSVAMGGSVLSTFYQKEEFYSGRDLYCLIPKENLTEKEMIFYSYYIELYKKNYSYGRQANKSLMDLEIPEKSEIPHWINNINLEDYLIKGESKVKEENITFNYKLWKEYKLSDIFNIIKGRGPSASEAKKNPGSTPYIGASAFNNGITHYSNHTPEHNGNVITIATDGSVGETFYQANPFCSTSNIAVLELKNYDLNPSVAMFICTIISQEKSKYNYGRKYKLSRVKETVIKLPSKEDGEPDYDYMENFINSLPYSKTL
jgi:hypothetical protein